ncbi:MAG: hypothetical protein RR342_01570 [Bacilli bacterium]
MKFEIGTEKFNEAVNRVYKGVGNMKIFMITEVIGIEGKEGNLILTSTDNSRNLEVVIKDVIPTDVTFYTATKANLLKALVNRTTSATIIMDILEDRVVFQGDCDANLEIVLNDEGTAPARISKINVEGEPKVISTETLKNFLTYLKGTLPASIDRPEFLGYRVKDGIAVTYNNFGSNLIETDWNDVNILIPSSIVNLFDLLEDPTVNIVTSNNKIRIETSEVVISGSLRQDVDKYSTERFTNIVYSENLFNTEVVIDKARLMDTLDRISLFVNKDDSSVFNMEVGKDCMILMTTDSNFVEKVAFESSNLEKSIQQIIGLTTLKSAVSSLQGDKVVVNFGDSGALRIKENKAYLVVPYARAK